MKEILKRLERARLKAGYQCATDAARAFGWNENTYRSHENGVRGMRLSIIKKYAKAFKVSPNWLVNGTDKNEIPIHLNRELDRIVKNLKEDQKSALLDFIKTFLNQ